MNTTIKIKEVKITGEELQKIEEVFKKVKELEEAREIQNNVLKVFFDKMYEAGIEFRGSLEDMVNSTGELRVYATADHNGKSKIIIG